MSLLQLARTVSRGYDTAQLKAAGDTTKLKARSQKR